MQHNFGSSYGSAKPGITLTPHILMSDYIFFIPVDLIVPSRQSWTLVPYDNKAILILLVGTKRIKYAFYCINCVK